MIINKKDSDSVQKTAECLKKGEICILPTDTVYGFSGIVEVCRDGGKNTDGIIRKIKGRAETKPLIQLIAKPEDIKKYTDDVIPPEILEKWPGALTVIVNTKKSCPMYSRFPTIAFRCPGDLWIRQVIELCDAPIYSTSVNRSGQPVLDTVDGIKAEFEKEVSLIVDDGDKKGALPSTLVIVDKDQIKVLRQGSVRI